MKAASGEPDLLSAQAKIMGEVRVVSDAMIEFIYSFFGAAWLKNFGSELPLEVCADLNAAPGLFDIRLPVLVNV